jgi:hypothetical protein
LQGAVPFGPAEEEVGVPVVFWYSGVDEAGRVVRILVIPVPGGVVGTLVEFWYGGVGVTGRLDPGFEMPVPGNDVRKLDGVEEAPVPSGKLEEDEAVGSDDDGVLESIEIGSEIVKILEEDYILLSVIRSF